VIFWSENKPAVTLLTLSKNHMKPALPQAERRERIAELKQQQQHQWALQSIALVTDELEKLHRFYTLIFSAEAEYSRPLTWISEQFPTSSVNILWESVAHARCFTWTDENELEQAFVSLCREEGLEKELESIVQLVFGGTRPHIHLHISSVQDIISLASDFDCEWWIVPHSYSWVMECSLFGTLWFVRAANGAGANEDSMRT
jgi:hypothetical protein